MANNVVKKMQLVKGRSYKTRDGFTAVVVSHTSPDMMLEYGIPDKITGVYSYGYVKKENNTRGQSHAWMTDTGRVVYSKAGTKPHKHDLVLDTI